MLTSAIPNWRLALNVPQEQYDFQMPIEVFTCTADINVSRFVTLSGNQAIRQSAWGEVPLGISVEYPASGLGGPAGTLGNPLRIYGYGYECYLLLAQACVAGDLLTPNFDGRGQPGIPCGAIALENGVAGQLCRVKMHTERGVAPCEFQCTFDSEYTRCPC